MYETTVKILKILYQTRITKENLASNLNLKENTITKSIIEINNLLEQLNLNKIQIYEKNLQLNLLKSEWQKVFKNLNSLTFDERVDYLYIKFIYFKFINLEKEKVELNLSRSSIDRCFLVVKKMLKKNGSKLSYNKEKENILIDISQYDKKIFVIKITKLILEEEILIEAQKKLLNNMKNFVLKIRIAELISIYKCLKFPTTAILLSFLCALNIYIDRFREEFINLDDKDIKSNKLLKKIENIVNYIGYSFNERYKKFLIYYINEISSNKYYFFEETYSKANIILEKLTNRFGIEDEKFKNYILQYLYLGILKKE
ncbi:MAG: hypothetical protein ACRDAG_00690, partial [Cetobacterium somerae]|uniref:hypothetical protein n=1 Tax=Cetobacterium somerae TaxID=188913 RepID=UPI003F3D0BDD